MLRIREIKMTGTTPDAPGTAVVTTVAGLAAFDFVRFDALLVGATGGTLDVYLQRKLDTDVWLDWVRFTQLAAGASAIQYSFSTLDSNTITSVGKWADAGTGTQVLAAGNSLGGHPGDQIRMVAVAGASTSAGAAATVYITGFTRFA